ncbi:MAG: type II toxin-antitoxin system ParD family antitoxin [Hyphomonas sp.]
MATTSMSLGPYWENFLKELVESGRFSTQSEAVREALRELESRENRLADLRRHLAEGAAQSAQGEYVTASPESILAKAREKRG